MRAEGQAHIDRIQAALQLVRQSLDWERALRRLDELNARVEDPTLWDAPKEAQNIMREQKQLQSAVKTVQEITSEMQDAVEYGDATNMLQIPLWPFFGLLALGIAYTPVMAIWGASYAMGAGVVIGPAITVSPFIAVTAPATLPPFPLLVRCRFRFVG